MLLETKITRPRVRSEHVSRAALLEELAQGSGKLTIVAAPPGFGKTTLLAEWAAQGDGSIAWLSLDEDDNDPVRFFSYLSAALRRVVPDLGGKADAVVRSPGADLIRVVLPLFLDDLTGLDHDVVLIVDDYHLIANPEIHRSVAYLVDKQPRELRVVLATREDPPIPLGRMRASGDLMEVRSADLRFTDEETTEFLSGGLGLELSELDVTRLQERTEGWPAALYLAALSFQGRDDASTLIERFAGDDRYLVDYLTMEVLSRQSPEVRAFLLETSVLRRLCGPLCDAVTGRNDSAVLLADLERSNLLLVPLDTKREWYRYHHLFGDLLRHELAATTRDGVSALHRKASSWYLGAGLIVDAADHSTAAGDVDAAVELVARNYAFFVGEGQLATALRWLDMLPESATQDWLICFAAGVVMAVAGRIDEAELWLARGEQAPQVERDGQDPAGPLASLAAALRLLRGDVGGTVQNARRSLASEDTPDPRWALGAQTVLVSGLWWSGGTAEASAMLESATRTAKTADLSANAVWALGIRAAIALEEGDATAAQGLVDEAIETMRAADLDEHPWSAMAHITHGTLLARRGDLPAAAASVEHGLRLGEQLGAWQVIVYASLALAEVRQAQRETTAARRLLTRVRDVLEALPDPGDGFERLAQTEKKLRLQARRRQTQDTTYLDLSPRELEVLRLLPSRLSQREIASELYVSFNTVRTHTRVIFRKLGVTSRAEAVARARELGLI